MKVWYIKWLYHRGYYLHKWGIVSWAWKNEYPPAFGYYPSFCLVKKGRVKNVDLRSALFHSKKSAEEYVLKEFWWLG